MGELKYLTLSGKQNNKFISGIKLCFNVGEKGKNKMLF
jgi:hypothetical protein